MPPEPTTAQATKTKKTERAPMLVDRSEKNRHRLGGVGAVADCCSWAVGVSVFERAGVRATK